MSQSNCINWFQGHTSFCSRNSNEGDFSANENEEFVHLSNGLCHVLRKPFFYFFFFKKNQYYDNSRSVYVSAKSVRSNISFRFNSLFVCSVFFSPPLLRFSKNNKGIALFGTENLIMF